MVTNGGGFDEMLLLIIIKGRNGGASCERDQKCDNCGG
jgi:hypothetical protein